MAMKVKKMAKNIENMPKLVMLKSCKVIYLIYKLFGNLFSKPRASSLPLKVKNSKK